MLLYDNTRSGNCYTVRLLFALLGVTYGREDLEPRDRRNRPALIGDLNPALRVPTLVLDDGRSLAESGAILFHFAEGTEYLPVDGFERAQVLQWMFFEQYDVEPNIAVVRFWDLGGVTVDCRHRPVRLRARRPRGRLHARRLSGRAGVAGPGRRPPGPRHDRGVSPSALARTAART